MKILIDACALEVTVEALNNISSANVNAEVVDVIRTDTIPDSYVADGSQPTLVQAILGMHQMMQEKSILDTTMTVKKPDGSTTAMTFTLDSATLFNTTLFLSDMLVRVI